MTDPISAAAGWLRQTYGGRVVVAGTRPIAEGRHSWLVACRFADEVIRGHAAPQPLLASTVLVPKDGGDPFPAANSAPLDELLNVGPGAQGGQPWRSRVNARGCLLAADALLHGAPASALRWEPEHEQPDWWSRLLAAHFPDAVTTRHLTWASASETIAATGPGGGAIVWLRRRYRDAEITGHLLYADSTARGVMVLDPQRGLPAAVQDSEVLELVVAAFRHASVEPVPAPWQAPAADLAAAVRKATAWLEATYDGEAVLVAPSEVDRTSRGWLFACTTREFAATGDWHHQMLDAALVVPQDGEAPFGLPNDDPWTYFQRWDGGAPDLPAPPDTGAAAWFAPTMAGLGPVRAERLLASWPEVLAELATLPEGTAGLVWARRQDRHGRETVGNLFLAVNEGGEPRIADAREPQAPPRMENSPLGLVVVTYAHGVVPTGR
ncbi:YrhB domain-containing protein [Amycolatopsis sp. NBC_00345]|uniref:YrhB domain-containing protein n=1 Tax=Amycolatopsis sp. NBC_00345 TaxID=2975955 RepID=UPI002E270A34